MPYILSQYYHDSHSRNAELGTTISALALAWVAKNTNTSTVILGASKAEQVIENLKALDVIPKLDQAVMDRIEGILGNKPEALVGSQFSQYTALYPHRRLKLVNFTAEQGQL